MQPDESSVNTSTLIVPGASSLTTSPLVVKNAKSACTSVSSMLARLRLWWNTDLPRAHRVQRGSKGTWPCIRCFCSASSEARVSLCTPKPSSSAPHTCDMHLPLLLPTHDCIPQSRWSFIHGHPAKYAISVATSPLCASTTWNEFLSWTNFQPAAHKVVALMMLLLMSATKVRKRALRCFTASVRQSCNATQAQTSAWPCISTVVPFAARYKDPSYVSSHWALYKPRCLELMTVVDAPESSNHQLPSSSFTYISDNRGCKNGKNCVNCWSCETVSSTFKKVVTLVRTNSTRTLTGDTKP